MARMLDFQMVSHGKNQRLDCMNEFQTSVNLNRIVDRPAF
jgi:hypothetical protein